MIYQTWSQLFLNNSKMYITTYPRPESQPVIRMTLRGETFSWRAPRPSKRDIARRSMMYKFPEFYSIEIITLFVRRISFSWRWTGWQTDWQSYNFVSVFVKRLLNLAIAKITHAICLKLFLFFRFLFWIFFPNCAESRCYQWTFNSHTGWGWKME